MTAITLPLLKDVTGALVLLGAVYSLKLFDIVWVMTQGGPANATQVLGTLEYQDTFTANEYGYGAAIANVMLILACAFAVLYVYLSRRRKMKDASATTRRRPRPTRRTSAEKSLDKRGARINERAEADVHA